MSSRLTLDQLIDEREAVRRVVDFYACLDRSDGPGCAACFTDDGVWERDNGALAGHGAIAAAVSRRPADRRTAHVITNIRFDLQATDRATVRFTLLAYEASLDDPAVVPPGRLAGIREGLDELHKADGAWRIRRRASTATMRGAPAA